MTALPLAHAGHWLVNVLYLVPLVIVVAMLGISTMRDRKAAAAGGRRGRPAARAPRRVSRLTQRRGRASARRHAFALEQRRCRWQAPAGVSTLVEKPIRWRPRASSSTVEAECSARSVCGATP